MIMAWPLLYATVQVWQPSLAYNTVKNFIQNARNRNHDTVRSYLVQGAASLSATTICLNLFLMASCNGLRHRPF